MKLKLLILILFLCQNIFSQKNKYIYSNGLQYFFIEKDKWVRYFQGCEGDNSKIREITNFKEGKKEGKFTFYSLDGNVTSEGHYLKDEEHGEIKSYDKKGVLNIIRNCVNGKTIESKEFSFGEISKHIKIDLKTNNVLTKEYDSYGNLMKSINKKGEIELVKLFNKKKLLINEFTLRHNKRFGKDIKYDKNGIISIEEFLENKTSIYTKYNSKNNSVLIEGIYNEKGAKEGEWKYYFSGKINHITSYKGGKKNGLFKKYNSNGKLGIIGNYKDGKKDGEWVYYKRSDNSIEKTVNYNKGIQE